jgi:hypothetical protein
MNPRPSGNTRGFSSSAPGTSVSVTSTTNSVVAPPLEVASKACSQRPRPRCKKVANRMILRWIHQSEF